jgi:hypothetical protein
MGQHLSWGPRCSVIGSTAPVVQILVGGRDAFTDQPSDRHPIRVSLQQCAADRFDDVHTGRLGWAEGRARVCGVDPAVDAGWGTHALMGAHTT